MGSPDGCSALGLMEGTGPSRLTEAGIICCSTVLVTRQAGRQRVGKPARGVRPHRPSLRDRRDGRGAGRGIAGDRPDAEMSWGVSPRPGITAPPLSLAEVDDGE